MLQKLFCKLCSKTSMPFSKTGVLKIV
jgi:hypothetical protein